MAHLNTLLTVALTFLIGLEVGHLMASGPLGSQLRNVDIGPWASHLHSVNLAGSQSLQFPPSLPPTPLPTTSLPALVRGPSLPVENRSAGQEVMASVTSLPGLQLSLDPKSKPSLVLIGGAKCGSTDAWKYLIERFKLEPGQAKHKVKEMWCLAREDHKSVHRCYDTIFAKAPPGAFTIDGTPAYIHLYDRHTQTGGNCEMSALNMANAAPDAAALALLRDPLKRSRSEFSWNLHANGGMFAPLLASDINTQVHVELSYFERGPHRESFDLLFREVDAVDAKKVFDAYRVLLDGYHIWLAQDPELCRKVSKRPVEKVGHEQIPWCFTWPILIPSLWYPLLLQWRSTVFRPRKAAVVQSEAYYASNSVLDQLMPMSPTGTFERRGRGHANQQRYHDSDSRLSAESVRRLTEFFELPNRRLLELLRRLPTEGVPVLPPVDEPGSWWRGR